MSKIIFIILIVAIAALFVIPESTLGEYKGLIQLKYFLRDSASKIKTIIMDLAKTGESDELKDLQNKATESLEDKIKEETKEELQ